ncbi:MAG: alcohol dehydrogenase catalytic domain-containing protein [Vampirovibrionia bacterium]
MKVAAYNSNNQMIISDMQKPELNGRKGAVLKVLGCGLCGSDIVKIQKDLVPSGTILGHEVVGIIENMDVDFQTQLKIGDKVVTAHHVPCYNCNYCKQKSFSMCETFKTTNLEPGGFAEYIYLSELHLMHNTKKVPEKISELQASLMEPLGCILRALDLAKIQENQSVMVVGLGFIGLLFVQALSVSGNKVLGCDLINERLAMAVESGAEFVFNSEDIEMSRQMVNNHIGFDGVDVVILASGANKSVDLAVNLVRNGGKIVIFASIPDENKGFINNDIYYKELEVLGAYSSSPEFLVSAMELIEKDLINMGKYCDIMPLEDINLAVENTLKHKTLKVYLKI